MPDSVRPLLLIACTFVAFCAGAFIIQADGPVLMALLVAVGGPMLAFVLFRPGELAAERKVKGKSKDPWRSLFSAAWLLPRCLTCW
jgi:hypothetical protein